MTEPQEPQTPQDAASEDDEFEDEDFEELEPDPGPALGEAERIDADLIWDILAFLDATSDHTV